MATSHSGSKVGRIAIALLALIVVGALAVLFLPVIQSLLYGVFVQSPALLWWTVIGVLGGVGVGSVLNADAGLTAFGIVLVFGLFVGLPMSGVYAQSDIAHNEPLAQMDELPNTSDEHVRVLPRSVADAYAQSSFQYPVYQLSDSDITHHDGGYTWSYGLAPDRLVVALTGNQNGAMYVDMETSDKRVDTVGQSLECGMGQLFTDSYGYRMNVDRFDVSHQKDTAFNVMHDGEMHIAQSYTTHDWKFRLGPIPQPYVVPRYGGTQIIDSECNVNDVPANKVESNPTLAGQNVYPYGLARFYTASEKYRNGIWNAWFVGRDVPEIASVPGDNNNQPFTVPTETANGTPDLTYFVAAEPAGSGEGVFEIYAIDAQTGEREVLRYDDTQLGPGRAAKFVRKENARVNWMSGSGESSSGTMEVSEPLPVVRGDTLFWHVRAVPRGSNGIAFTSMVNATSGAVTNLEGDDEIYAFVSRDMAEDIQNDTEKTQPTDGITIAVVDNGTVVDTINVSKNATVRITQPHPNA